MRNAGLEETQTGIKIAGRNINNLRYADDTTLMAESEEELKGLLMKVESEKVGLKLNIQKMKIMASGPTTSWEIDGETVSDFIFLGSKITKDGDCSHEIKRRLSPGKNTGVGSHSLLRGIIPTQASNPGVLHYRQILYCLSHQRCPRLDLKAQLCHSTELCYWVTYLTTLGLLLLILKIEIIIVPIL